MQRGNWIAGRWCAAQAKQSFQPVLRFASKDGRGAWPRSDAQDLEAAAHALRSGSADWQALSRVARRTRLGRVLDRWQSDPEGVDRLARGLALETGQLDLELELALDWGDYLLESAAPAARLGCPVLVQVAADQLFEGLVRAVFPALVQGAAVLLLADKDLPWAAEEFVRQLASDECLGRSIALLHDDRGQCEAAAREADSLVAPGPAGLPCLPTSRNVSWVVTLEMDPQQAARTVWREAFDPVVALSGQRTGQVGRVICHERCFSSFTQALLHECDEQQAVPACRTFVTGLASRVGDLCRLGLDEGATLLRGGHGNLSIDDERQPRGILTPTVFTNVEPGMRLARAKRPAPLLSLMRARTDSVARALAEEFDSASG